MANVWTSSLKLFSNLSWPFSLSPTNLNFSPARFKMLGPANRGNRRDTKKKSAFLDSIVLLVLQESISWIMVSRLVSTLTYHKVDQRLLPRKASVFHIKQSLEQGLEITFDSYLSMRNPLMQCMNTKCVNTVWINEFLRNFKGKWYKYYSISLNFTF